MKAFRIHSRTDPLDSVLDPTRPDGWVASDETYDTQPYGVSASPSLTDLASYVEEYSMEIKPGDRLLELEGQISPEQDRDQFALRLIVDRYTDLGEALPWLRAFTVDLDDVVNDIEEDDFDEPPSVRKWLLVRLDEGAMYEIDPEFRGEVLKALLS